MVRNNVLSVTPDTNVHVQSEITIEFSYVWNYKAVRNRLLSSMHLISRLSNEHQTIVSGNTIVQRCLIQSRRTMHVINIIRYYIRQRVLSSGDRVFQILKVFGESLEYIMYMVINSKTKIWYGIFNVIRNVKLFLSQTAIEIKLQNNPLDFYRTLSPIIVQNLQFENSRISNKRSLRNGVVY